MNDHSCVGMQFAHYASARSKHTHPQNQNNMATTHDVCRGSLLECMDTGSPEQRSIVFPMTQNA